MRLFAALLLAVTAPAQVNHMLPGAWTRVAPQYQNHYAVTGSEIVFGPYHPTLGAYQTGVQQSVDIWRAGWYEFGLRNSPSIRSTGAFSIELRIGGYHIEKFAAETWMKSVPVFIPTTGPVVVSILVNTSNLLYDSFSIEQPRLHEAAAPMVGYHLSDLGLSRIRAEFSTHAPMLFASTMLAHTYGPLPGIDGIIMLRPETTVLLAVADKNGWARFDARVAFWTMRGSLPRVYLQAFDPGDAQRRPVVGSCCVMDPEGR